MVHYWIWTLPWFNVHFAISILNPAEEDFEDTVLMQWERMEDLGYQSTSLRQGFLGAIQISKTLEMPNVLGLRKESCHAIFFAI